MGLPAIFLGAKREHFAWQLPWARFSCMCRFDMVKRFRACCVVKGLVVATAAVQGCSSAGVGAGSRVSSGAAGAGVVGGAGTSATGAAATTGSGGGSSGTGGSGPPGFGGASPTGSGGMPGGAGAAGSGGTWGAAGVAGSPGSAGTGVAGTAGIGAGGSEKHVLIVGVDGLGSNQIKRAHTPRMDALIADNTAFTYTAFAGGVPGTKTEQSTSSWPGWASIHTGVWADKHGLLSNLHLVANNFDQHLPLCRRLHSVRPGLFCSSIVHWRPINDGMVTDANHEAIGADDNEVRRLVIDHLNNADPIVLFVHFDELDGAGHAHGSNSDQYRSKLTEIDAHIGAFVDAVNNRPRAAAEDWMILIVSDHGHTPTGGHGGQSDDERIIPMINRSSGAIKGEVAEGPGHVAVPATVFAHLGLTPDPGWGWEAPAFGM